MKSYWPQSITIVCHGESAGDVARETAEAANALAIECSLRDMDRPLSELGEKQTRAIARWFLSNSNDHRPTVYLSSPYLRAQETARIIYDIVEEGETNKRFIFDERLREREFGRIEGYTRAGIIDRFPAEAEAYDKLGKFYYRPPSGESWCDVVLRLRGIVESLARDYSGEHVLIASHSIVVLSLRYLLEEMDEKEVLQVDRDNRVLNCSLTKYVLNARSERTEATSLKLDLFNFVVPLNEADVELKEKESESKI